MLTRRQTLKITAATSLAASFPLLAAEAAASPLGYTVTQAGATGFRRTPVLLTGKKEAVLIDGGFTLSDGRLLADAIKASGKDLKTIFISCNDPDYYFGLRPVVEAFPHARVLARPDTIAAIKSNVEAKLAIWGPQLKDNGPQVLADVVMPETLEARHLKLEGHRIEIIEVNGMHDRRYLHVPSLQGVFGGVLVSSGIHVWMADTATSALRATWVKALDAIIALNPKVVVPAHMLEGAPQGLAAVRFTRDYLLAYEAEVSRAKDSTALIAAMKTRFPQLEDATSLELGAKVVKGEMKWG